MPPPCFQRPWRSNSWVGAPFWAILRAMTRARQTLALARFPGRRPLQDALEGIPSTLLRQEPIALPPPAPELARRYRRLSLRDVFLGFSGYRSPGHPVHRAIAALSAADTLRVRIGPDRWELLDRSGTVVGQLARGYETPTGMRCASATVMAVVNWDRERSEPQYRDGLRSESWETVVPELVFEPN